MKPSTLKSSGAKSFCSSAASAVNRGTSSAALSLSALSMLLAPQEVLISMAVCAGGLPVEVAVAVAAMVAGHVAVVAFSAPPVAVAVTEVGELRGASIV